MVIKNLESGRLWKSYFLIEKMKKRDFSSFFQRRAVKRAKKDTNQVHAETGAQIWRTTAPVAQPVFQAWIGPEGQTASTSAGLKRYELLTSAPKLHRTEGVRLDFDRTRAVPVTKSPAIFDYS